MHTPLKLQKFLSLCNVVTRIICNAYLDAVALYSPSISSASTSLPRRTEESIFDAFLAKLFMHATIFKDLWI